MNRYDDLQIRCPKLGGEVTFAYCRIEQGDTPCSRVIGCWQASIPIETYLKDIFSEELLHRYRSERPKDRLATIFEVVDSFKKKSYTGEHGPF